MKRLKAKVKVNLRKGRGRSLSHTIESLKSVLMGWFNYFRLAEVKNVFEDLDGWLRRRLRCILWRQWKRGSTRYNKLLGRGLSPERARTSAFNGRGAWWNAGKSHMNQAFPKKYFDALGLYSFVDSLLAYCWRIAMDYEPPWYGTVCPVVWEDGRREPTSYPISNNPYCFVDLNTLKKLKCLHEKEISYLRITLC